MRKPGELRPACRGIHLLHGVMQQVGAETIYFENHNTSRWRAGCSIRSNHEQEYNYKAASDAHLAGSTRTGEVDVTIRGRAAVCRAVPCADFKAKEQSAARD